MDNNEEKNRFLGEIVSSILSKNAPSNNSQTDEIEQKKLSMSDIVSGVRSGSLPSVRYTNNNTPLELLGTAALGAGEMSSNAFTGVGGRILNKLISLTYGYHEPPQGEYALGKSVGLTDDEIRRQYNTNITTGKPFSEELLTDNIFARTRGKLADVNASIQDTLKGWNEQLVGTNPTPLTEMFHGTGTSGGHMGTMGAMKYFGGPAIAWALAHGLGESFAEYGEYLTQAHKLGLDRNPNYLKVGDDMFATNTGLNFGLDALMGFFSPLGDGIKNRAGKWLFDSAMEVGNENLQEPSQQVIQEAAMNALQNNTNFYDELKQLLSQGRWSEVAGQIWPEVTGSTLITSILTGGLLGDSNANKLQEAQKNYNDVYSKIQATNNPDEVTNLMGGLLDIQGTLKELGVEPVTNTVPALGGTDELTIALNNLVSANEEVAEAETPMEITQASSKLSKAQSALENSGLDLTPLTQNERTLTKDDEAEVTRLQEEYKKTQEQINIETTQNPQNIEETQKLVAHLQNIEAALNNYGKSPEQIQQERIAEQTQLSNQAPIQEQNIPIIPNNGQDISIEPVTQNAQQQEQQPSQVGKLMNKNLTNFGIKEDKEGKTIRQDIVRRIKEAKIPRITRNYANAVGNLYVAQLRYLSKYSEKSMQELHNAINPQFKYEHTIFNEEGQPLNVNGRALFGEDKNGQFISLIKFTNTHNPSTAIHEIIGHVFLKQMLNLDEQGVLSGQALEDLNTLLKEYGATREGLRMNGEDGKNNKTAFQEQFAADVERYFYTGEAPNEKLKALFERVKEWFSSVYQTINKIIYQAPDGKKYAAEIVTPEVKKVLDNIFNEGTLNKDKGQTTNTAQNTDQAQNTFSQATEDIDDAVKNFITPEEIEQYNQIASHGTGHIIENNEFQLSKIGSGEGNKAFGWGAYLAQNLKVNQVYRKYGLPNHGLGTVIVKTKDGNSQIFTGRNGRNLNDVLPFELAEWLLNISKDNPDRTMEEIIEGLKEHIKETIETLSDDEKQQHLQYLETLENTSDVKFLNPKNGNIYFFDIPEDYDLLDWDKELKNQPPKVKKAIEKIRKKIHDWGLEKVWIEDGGADITEDISEWTGEEFYSALASLLYSLPNKSITHKKYGTVKDMDQFASLMFNSVGIPGLRFLDAFSRNKGEGSHNFVIWNTDTMKMLGLYWDSDEDAKEYFRKTKEQQEQKTQGNKTEIYEQSFGENAAKTWDKEHGKTYYMDNLAVAKEMTKAGTDPHKIKLATGWEIHNGRWKMDRPDGHLFRKDFSGALDDIVVKYESGNFNEFNEIGRISDFFFAPELFSAYPDLKNIPLVWTVDDKHNYSGSYYGDKIAINIKNEGALSAYQKSDVKKANWSKTLRAKPVLDEIELTLIHEIQHAIQEREGWPNGTNVETEEQKYLDKRAEYESERKKRIMKLPEIKKILKDIDELKEKSRNALSDLIIFSGNVKFVGKDISKDPEYIKKTKEYKENISDPLMQLMKKRDERIKYYSNNFIDTIEPEYQKTPEKKYPTDKAIVKMMGTMAYKNNLGERDASVQEKRHTLTKTQRKNTLMSEDDVPYTLDDYISEYGRPKSLKGEIENYDQLISVKGSKKLDEANGNTFIMDNLNLARKKFLKGESAEHIKFATGWEQDESDGSWWYEIQDKNINKQIVLYAQQPKTPSDKVPVNLEDIYDNEELFKAYPNLRKLPVYFMNEMDNDNGVYYKPDSKGGERIAIRKKQPTGKVIYTLIHEIQHAVQYREGWWNNTKGTRYYGQIESDWEKTEKKIKNIDDKVEKIQKQINNLLDIQKEKMLKNGVPKEDIDEIYLKPVLEFFKDKINEYNEIRKLENKRSEIIKAHDDKYHGIKSVYEAYRAIKQEAQAFAAMYRADMSEAERRTITVSQTRKDNDIQEEYESYNQDQPATKNSGVFNPSDPDSYNQVRAKTEEDPEINAQEQLTAVRKQYEGTDKWLKAPNGKQTIE